MRVLLLILAFISGTAAQSFQFVPEKPREIVRFKQQFVFSEKEPVVLSQFFDDDKKLLIIGKQTVRVWDTKSRKLLSEVSHEAGKDRHFDLGSRLSPDGSKLIVTDSFRWKFGKEKIQLGARVYDLTTGQFFAELKNDRNSVRTASWSANGQTLVTVDQTVFSSDEKETEACFWDGETLQKRTCVILPGKLDWDHLAKDGEKFFAGVSTSPPFYVADRIYILDTTTGTVLKNIEGGRMWATPAPFNQSEKIFVNSTADSVEFWDTDDAPAKMFQVTRFNRGGERLVNFGGFSSDGKYATVENGKNVVEIYEAKTGKLRSSFPGMEWTPRLWINDDKVFIASYCGKAKAWSTETGALLYQIKLVCKDHTEILESVSDDEDLLRPHPNGKYFLTYSGTAVRIWNAATGELLQTVVAPGFEAEKLRKPKSDDHIKGRSARWSADGKYLYVQGQDGRSILQYEFTGK